MRPAGQVISYRGGIYPSFYPFQAVQVSAPAVFPFEAFLSRAGLTCTLWNGLTLDRKRAEVGALLYQGRTIREGGTLAALTTVPIASVAYVDSIVRQMDTICAPSYYPAYAYYRPVYVSAWPFIRFGGFRHRGK